MATFKGKWLGKYFSPMEHLGMKNPRFPQMGLAKGELVGSIRSWLDPSGAGWIHQVSVSLFLAIFQWFDIAPENRGPLESRRFLLETIIFRGKLLVSGRVLSFQWLFLVPLKGGLGGIVHPPLLAGNSYHLYTTYSPCLMGVICHRSHLLGEPEATIEYLGIKEGVFFHGGAVTKTLWFFFVG